MVRKIEQTDCHLGDKLKALRHDRGFNIKQASEATHLHAGAISAFEKGDYNKLPEGIYAKQFLRTYVRFLGGDEKYFLECFETERGTCDFIDPLLLPRQKARRSLFIVTPRILKSAGICLTLSLILAYLGFEIREILIPPQIEILNPGDGYSTDQAIISIKGRVFERADVLVNGEKVLLDKEGVFTSDIDLERGLNLITVEAKKRYSKVSIVHRRIILENENYDKLTKY